MKVIRTAMLTCIMAGLAAVATAQKDAEIDYEYGFKGGLSLSTFHQSGLDTRINPGFVLGGYIRMPVDSQFSVQPELYFSMEGAKVSQNNIEFLLGLDYIQLPLLAIYQLNNRGTWKPAFFAGPQISFLVNNESNVTIDDGQIFTPDDWVAEAKNTVFGVALGAGLEVDLGAQRFTLDIRYSRGLTNTFDDRVPEHIKNGALVMMAGFIF